MVAWKKAALGFEMRDAQLLVLLALISVFEKTLGVCVGFAGAVVHQSGQRYNILGEAMSAHTLLPFGMLLAGGNRGVHTCWV